MSTLQGTIYGNLAVASVQVVSADEVDTAAFFNQRGFTADPITVNGPGDTTLVLTNGCNLVNSGIVTTGINNNAYAALSVEYLTTTTLRVRTATISTATPPVVIANDVDYWIMIDEISPN